MEGNTMSIRICSRERGVNALQAYLQLVPRNGAALISMFRNMNGIGLYRYPSIKLRVIIRDL